MNALNLCWSYWVNYELPYPALGPLTLSTFLAEHITGQFRLLLLVLPCWMVASWLPTVLNMLEDIPCQWPIIKDFIMDVLVGWVPNGLPFFNLTLWLLRNLCCADKGSLPQSVRQG